jgi:hypothetical protein
MRFERISEPLAHEPKAPPANAARSSDSLAFEWLGVRPQSRAARRRDAGRRALTSRDLAALRWIGEQYTVRLDVAGVLLGRLSPESIGMLSRRTVRQRIDRWEQAGWISRHRLLGYTWIVATTAGLRHAGLDHLGPWQPAAVRLAHHHAVSLVRLAREPEPCGGGWICERELWRHRGRAAWHLADGALPVEVPALWQQRGIGEAFELVEVELHQKARRRVLAAFKTLPPGTRLVTYYVPAGLHAAISAQLASVVGELGGSVAVRVELLPHIPGIVGEVAA